MSGMKPVIFEPLDSIFFREAKPFNAGEGGFLDSQFPPPAQTISGSIRTAIGEASRIDWTAKADVRRVLGTADDPSPLSFAGPFLLKGGGRLYPVPLNLLCREEMNEKTGEKKGTWTRLVPSDETFKTDMGDRRLPRAEPEKLLEGAKPVEAGWLDAANMRKVLNGDLPDSFISSGEIFVREPRAGIGRNNRKGVVSEGQLYFTRHLRLKEGYTLGMAVQGAASFEGGLVRFGGEGRLARMAVGAALASLVAPTVNGQVKGLILTLLTHGDFAGRAEPDWNRVHPALKPVTACVGKPVREGGWDYAERRPKPLKSLVPAGSCYFVQVADSKVVDVIARLHGKHIGQRTAFGYGEIAVALWK